MAVDSGHFMGFPPMYLRVPDPQGFVFTQAFQSIGLGLASGIGAAIARPDRLTVACVGDGGLLMALPGARDARPVAAADARRRLRRRRLRRRGPPLRPAGRAGRARALPRHRLRRAGPRGRRRGRSRSARRRTSTRSRPGWSSATARCSSMRRSRPTSARNGSRRPSSDPSPVARRAARRRRGDRPDPAVERGDAGAAAAAAVRGHARADAPRDQPLRRPRARVGVGLAGDRRARRHPLRRADPLDQRQGRRGRRLRARRPGSSARRS